MTTLFEWIDRAAGFLLVGFLIGCVASYLREVRRSERQAWRWLEWLLLPPGFAALLVLLQQNTARLFAFHPQATLVGCGLIALIATGFVIVRKRRPGTILAWVGGLVGAPALAISIIFAGIYLQSPSRFETLRKALTRIEQAAGQQAPDFPFTLVETRAETSLAAYRGRLVLLNVWATWCAPCLREMPDLDRLQQEFRGRLVVINLSDEPFETIESYLARHPMVTTHARVPAAEGVPEFYQFGGVRPATFVIDPAGKVVHALAEARDYSYFRSVVRRHLP